jgi:hypothetical protein
MTRISVGLCLLLPVLFGAFALPSLVHAASLNYTTATTIFLTSSATALTIAPGSVADALTVNATSVVVTLSGLTGGSFTITAPPSYDFSVSGGASAYSCMQGVASLTLSQAGTFTIVPLPQACTPAVTAPPAPPQTVGVAAGYAPSPATPAAPSLNTSSSTTTITSSSTYASISSLQALITSLTAQLNALLAEAGQEGVASPSPSSSPRFTRALYLGLTGTAVVDLQSFLAKTAAIYPEARVTGYFGALTQKAVQRFQAKYKIAKPGQSAYGYVGPATRAKFNALIGQGLNP